MGELSITHWLIILAILLLFFGPSKLPGLGTSLGKAIRGFKAGLNEIEPTDTAAQQKRAEQIEAASTSGPQHTVDPTQGKDPIKKG